MKKAVFIFSAVFIFNIANYNQTENKILRDDLPFRKIDVGEEITYVVKYLFISIGEIKLKVTKREITNNDTIYSAIAYIDSYEGLPFVNLHQIYETKFNSRQIPIFFRGTIIDKDTTFTEYTFNYKSNRIHILKGSKTKNEIWTDSTVALDREYLDGLSLFYYARMRTGRKASYNTPVFINEKGEKTVIRCYDKPEPIEIDAVDYKVNCVYLDGETEFKGIFGLTGYFEGWFSNDDYAVPIYAKMSVIIGNITVELKEWKKKNWTPPKFHN